MTKIINGRRRQGQDRKKVMVQKNEKNNLRKEKKNMVQKKEKLDGEEKRLGHGK